MNLVAVKSSNLQAVGWQDGKLRILFQSGSMYDYFGVPASVHGALMAAGSKNEYFTENVKNVFEYEKVNPREEGNLVMGKNKQQKQAEERASAAAPKAAQPVATPVAVAEAPKPAAQAEAPLSKQQQTLMRLIVALREKRQIEVKPEMLMQDGKFILIRIGESWPTIQVGPTGGITVVELKSYPVAFDAAIDGDNLLAKQKAREAKKANGSVPAPAPAAQPAATAKDTPAPKQTPTARKQKADAAVEAQLQSA